MALINKLELQEKFILNFNYIDSLELEAIFKASDIVALPYTKVSQSGVEQMAFGFSKPVIVTDIFFDKTWINKKAGLVAVTQDPQSMADKLLQLVSHPEEAKQYGEYGYQYSTEHYNWEHVADLYFRLYNKIGTK